MRILVTGGAGFIGSHVVDACVDAGHSVCVVDNLWEQGGGKRSNINPRARFYKVDITDRAALTEVFAGETPEAVCHLGAQHSVKLSTDDPSHDVRANILGLINVLHSCVQVGTRKLVFASSSAIFGTPAALPVTVDTPQWPESPYGITKMSSEHYLRYWRATYGLEYTALRYGNVYGPRQDPNGEAGVIAIFTQRILDGRPVRIDWDGEQAKDYVYVEDVARANLLALERGDGQALLIGTGKPTSVNEIYRRLTELIGRKSPVIRAPKRSGDVRLFYFDTSHTEREFGWRPEVDLLTGMGATIDYFSAQSMAAEAAR